MGNEKFLQFCKTTVDRVYLNKKCDYEYDLEDLITAISVYNTNLERNISHIIEEMNREYSFLTFSFNICPIFDDGVNNLIGYRLFLKNSYASEVIVRLDRYTHELKMENTKDISIYESVLEKLKNKYFVALYEQIKGYIPLAKLQESNLATEFGDIISVDFCQDDNSMRLNMEFNGSKDVLGLSSNLCYTIDFQNKYRELWEERILRDYPFKEEDENNLKLFVTLLSYPEYASQYFRGIGIPSENFPDFFKSCVLSGRVMPNNQIGTIDINSIVNSVEYDSDSDQFVLVLDDGNRYSLSADYFREKVVRDGKKLHKVPEK